jgi:DNA-binding XRE family transcriptional regulator
MMKLKSISEASSKGYRLGMKMRNQDEGVSPLKELRLKAGLTQVELARLLPDKTRTKTLTQQIVSAWEKGKYEPELSRWA